MPRKKRIYTHLFPYHIYARSNNREWFYIRTDRLWKIFVEELNKLICEHHFQIYAFVLMHNHYHLVASCHRDHPLPIVTHKLQMRVSRRINKTADRINHVFGGPYKATLIKDPTHFATCFKYVLRNPVKSNISARVEDFSFSTYSQNTSQPQIFLSCLEMGKGMHKMSDLDDWLNTPFSNEQNEVIKKSLKKSEYKYSKRDKNKMSDVEK